MPVGWGSFPAVYLGMVPVTSLAKGMLVTHVTRVIPPTKKMPHPAAEAISPPRAFAGVTLLNQLGQAFPPVFLSVKTEVAWGT